MICLHEGEKYEPPLFTYLLFTIHPGVIKAEVLQCVIRAVLVKITRWRLLLTYLCSSHVYVIFPMTEALVERTINVSPTAKDL